MIETILYTIIKRPYVFAFFLTFLFLGIRKKGVVPTLYFLFSGYLIAWASEALSIRTGFPYGWYFYMYENLKGEWINFGVPVWDSLSYTFLNFAGLSMAEFLMKQSNSMKQILKLTLIGALFVVLLDVIVDPLAHLGERWFLGKIYYYPYPGYYFDVPMSNFIGWFFVALLTLFINLLFQREYKSKNATNDFINTYGGVLLYFSICLFNLGITLWLQEWILALCSLGWMLIPAAAVILKIRKRNSVL